MREALIRASRILVFGMSNPKSFAIDDDLLKRFVSGRLNAEEEVNVALAIEKSPELQNRIAGFSEDGLLDRVKELASASHISISLATMQQTIASGVAPSEPEPIEGVPRELIDSTDYHVLEELGRGGMGVVYLAKYLPMDRMEVLKVLNDRMVQKESARQRFISEMKAIGKLNHPSIATAYQRVLMPTQLVFSMEYVPGIDLQRFIRRYHPVPLSVACTLISKTATALQHAHSRNMVHRDIKPSNVMVFEDEGKLQVKVLDFGLAKAISEHPVDRITADGTMLGTPQYMAPEQAMDAAGADIRADVYSLGCTMYHLITGRPPFSGTYQSVLMAHAQKEAAPLRDERPDIPLEISEIVEKMIAKSPSDRYPTPRAVSDVLQPYAGAAVLIASSNRSAAKHDTKLDIASPSRDTSVDRGDSVDVSSVPTKPEPLIVQPLSETSGETADAHDVDNREQPQRRISSHLVDRIKPPYVVLIAGSLLAAFGILAATLIIRMQTGTLVVENLPDNAKVRVDGNQIEIRTQGQQFLASTSLSAGVHEVIVEANGLTIHGERVSIDASREKRITLRAQAHDKPSEQTAPNAVSSSSEPDTSPRRGLSLTDDIAATPEKPPHDSSFNDHGPARVAEITHGNAGDWAIEGDQLVTTSSQSRGYYGMLFGDRDWTDYEFSFDFKCSTSPICTSAYIRAPDPNNTFEVGLVWHNCVATLAQRQGGYRTFVREKMQRLAAERWYTVRVIVSNGDVEGYLDGERFLEVKDQLPDSGRVGFLCYRWTAGEKTAFKNIRVIDADGRPLWTGLPTLPNENHDQTSSHDEAPFPFPIVHQTGEWTSGAESIEQHQKERKSTQLVFGKREWQNYDLSFRAKRVSGTHGFKALFHWRDENNHMIFGLGNYYNRGHDTSYVLNGSWARDPVGHFMRLDDDSDVELNRWYRVEIRVRESNYECYLDGELICEGVNERFSSGYVGLATWDSHAQFKDIVVSSPEGVVLLSGSPPIKSAAKDTEVEDVEE